MVFSCMNGKEGNTDQLKYAFNGEGGWAASKLDSSIIVDDSKSDDEKEVGDFVPPMPSIHSSLKIESFEQDPVFYVGKSVMESKLPELVVCYKENICHVVKDICVDEGVPFGDRFLFDPGVSEENLRIILPIEDINSEIAKEKVDLDTCIPDILKPSSEKGKSALCLPIPDVLISSEEKGSKNEFSLGCDSKKLMPIEEADVNSMDEIANVTLKAIFSLGELLSMPEVDMELSQPGSSHNNVDKAERQSIQRPSENTIIAMASACEETENGNEQAFLVNPVVHVAEELYSGHHEAVSGTLALDSATKADETVLASTAMKSITEGLENGSRDNKMASPYGDFVPESTHDGEGGSVPESTSTIGDESSDNNRVETICTSFNSHSSTLAASGGEKDSQNGGSEHIESCSSRLEGTNMEPFSSQLQYSLEETNFSASGPLLGLISYSGPIANSGSVSLRSDSSTTSACSFAFPILQSEWNNSPVRMVKADRRHFRKHRNWRQGLLCCRF
ncbi:uncharacterized protein LOC110660740 isoform X2 [Hevea brasiliensis]|nr:uncharacterized protein LOC110660740 isoform X2 [Hevea brasiliensis]XP_021674843.2 uncharacterized protein LOC110660740 isoform X2 [Hevea brasiliensis]